MKKIILVTGVAGFLGSHVAEKLLAKGHEVFGIDNFDGGVRENIPEGVRFLLVDICDERAVQRLFAHVRFDAVIHCAAFASENLSHRCRLHTYKSIVLGSANLVNHAVGFGTGLFISMSSIAVYGAQEPPFSESDTPLPCDPYGAAKACMEADLKAAHAVFGMNYILFRPHNIIGTRQSLADSTRNVASIFIRQMLEGKPMTIFGDGEQTRAWSPVSFVADIIASSVDRPESWNTTYNIGGDERMTVTALATTLSILQGVPLNTVNLPERHEVKHAYSAHGRVRSIFQDLYEKPRHSVSGCLQEMLNEAKAKPLPAFKLPPPNEIEKCTS